MAKNVSEDFRQSMAELWREVQSMRKEHAEMKRELEELRTVATSANEAAVKQRKRAARQAVLQDDIERMRELSTSSTDLIEQELLRQPTQAPMVEIQPPNQYLHQQMVKRYKENAIPTITKVKIEVNSNREDKRKELGRSWLEQQVKESVERKQRQELDTKINQLKANQIASNKGSRFGLNQNTWSSPFDDF